MSRKINKTYRNNIQQWMEDNLSKSDFENLVKMIPGELDISPRTWINYRNGTTEIGINTLSKLYDILLPYAKNKMEFSITNLINQ